MILFYFWYVTVLLWWCLAFVPVEGASVLREVCFGILPGGLPDAGGWLTLTSPLFMGLALCALNGREIAVGLASLPQPARVALVLVPVVGLSWVGVTVGQVVAARESFSRPATLDPLPEDYPRTDRPVPEFALVDQHGQILDSRDLNEPVVMTFAFAHCQTICPTLVTQLKASGVERCIIVTLDPWRDTPGALPGLASKWGLGPGMQVASGEVEAVQKVIADFGVTTERDESTGDIVHPGLVFILDGRGQIAYTFNNPPAAWLAEAVQRLP